MTIGVDGMTAAGVAGAFVVGCVVGAAYFLALWATVRGLPSARHPAPLFIGSYVTRLAVVGGAFLVLVRMGGLPWIGAGLAGFILARMVLVRRLGTDRRLVEDTP